MTSLVLGDLILDYLTPSVNAPQVSRLHYIHALCIHVCNAMTQVGILDWLKSYYTYIL
jgi:hypothetical protein